MTDRHIMLIGMMGAGKSSVGSRLAERLHRPFVDVDEVIAASAATPIPDIFAAEGEAGFRARERTALAEVCASPQPLVVATGGGAMGDAENRRVARATATMVWLRAEPDALATRLGTSAARGDRPLLATGDPGETLARLAALRAGAYEAAADLTIDTDERSVAEVVDAVVAALGALGVAAGESR